MLVALGLGNPGDRYESTRHNIGKEVIVSLIDHLGLPVTAGRGEFYYALDPSRDLGLVVPSTYMNTSGISALHAIEQFDVDLRDLLVVCDDFSLPLGTIRIRTKGSDGGHNGLASLIYNLGSQDFPRLRLGVGPVACGMDPADFVLSRFEPREKQAAYELKATAREAVLAVATEGLERAMNAYNRKVEE